MSYCSVIYCCDIATFNIALLQCDESCTNESVLFKSDTLLHCSGDIATGGGLQCESPLKIVSCATLFIIL